MTTKSISTLCFIFLSVCAVAQRGTITTFRVDGLIISKARYDSLKIEREHITTIRSLPPDQASSAYGSRASAGVAVITTSKMFVVKPASGSVQSASGLQEKEALLSQITESQVVRMRNLNAEALQQQFGLRSPQGAVVVYLRD